MGEIYFGYWRNYAIYPPDVSFRCERWWKRKRNAFVLHSGNMTNRSALSIAFISVDERNRVQMIHSKCEKKKCITVLTDEEVAWRETTQLRSKPCGVKCATLLNTFSSM